MNHTHFSVNNCFVWLAILVTIILPTSQVIAKEYPDIELPATPVMPQAHSAIDIDADYLAYGTGATETKSDKDPNAAGGIIRLMFNWTDRKSVV